MLDSETKKEDPTFRRHKADRLSVVSVILSIIAIVVSAYTLSYIAKGYQFSRGSLTMELHRYFIEHELFQPDPAYLARFSFDASFYDENKAEIEQLFNVVDYSPPGGLVLTEEDSSVVDVAFDLLEEYSDSFEGLKAENDKLKERAIELLSFYNELGILLQSGILDEALAKKLFASDFTMFYHFYFVPYAFSCGSCLDNQFYLYLTGERYEAFYKIVHFTNASEKYENTDPLEALGVPKDGILYLANKWR